MKSTFYNEMLDAAIDELKGQRMLVSPLDWGLGHASRCVPIVRHLLAKGKEVVLAGNGDSLLLLKREFPELEAVELGGVTVHYSRHKSQMWTLAVQLPQVFRVIRKEHRSVAEIVRQWKIDTIVSDNRFGLWRDDVESVYVTHQLWVKMPKGWKWLEGIVKRWHGCVIKHYTYCWVPDVDGKDNLAGDLAHKYPLPRNARWIGWLSRFERMMAGTAFHEYENVAVLSGPEPQRQMWEDELRKGFLMSGKESLIVRGKMENKTAIQDGSVKIVATLPTQELYDVMKNAKELYCRSGYSTLMDLAVIGRSSHLRATPGQPEQEYLEQLHSK